MTTGRINQVTTLYTVASPAPSAPERVSALASRKSEYNAGISCVQSSSTNQGRSYRVSQPSVGLDFYQNESWNDSHTEVYVSRLPVSIAIVLGYTPTSKIAPDSRLRRQSNTFTSVANAHSDLRPIIDGVATFVAR